MLDRDKFFMEAPLILAQMRQSNHRRKMIRLKGALFAVALMGSFLSLIVSIWVCMVNPGKLADGWYMASLAMLLFLSLWSNKIVPWVLK